MPSLVAQVTELLEEGGASHPDVIEFVFTSLSTVFKHLARHLSTDLPAALRATARLRYSVAAGRHVRAFAAQVRNPLGSLSGRGVRYLAVRYWRLFLRSQTSFIL